jgi:hypothetical protein
MKAFTDIGQFREVIRAVKSHHDYQGKDENGDAIYGHSTPYPTLRFRGTVKLHGTNASIIKYGEDRYVFQSRENELELMKDNARFMALMSAKPYQKMFDNIVFMDSCDIYGEWCGEGIQKGVAISQLSKRFVIFAVKIDGEYQDVANYMHLANEAEDIYHILNYPYWYMDIDFNYPEISQNKLIDLTMEVERECPVGKAFGVIGTGEGIVWEHNENGQRYIFKVKGEKHQNSKVKTLTTVNIEEVEGMRDFIEYTVTENRMEQGIGKLIENHIPIEIRSTGEFIKWVYNDVIKEESDTIVANKIDVKKLGAAVSAKAKPFWMNYLNTHV